MLKASTAKLSAAEKDKVFKVLYSKVKGILRSASAATLEAQKANDALLSETKNTPEALIAAQTAVAEKATMAMTNAVTEFNRAILECKRQANNNEDDWAEILNTRSDNTPILELIVTTKLHNTSLLEALLSHRRTTAIPVPPEAKRADAPAAPPDVKSTSTVYYPPLVDVGHTDLEAGNIFHLLTQSAVATVEVARVLANALSPEIIRKLMQNTITHSKYTPFLCAVRYQRPIKYMQYLLDLGSDPNTKTVYGQSALFESIALGEPADALARMSWLINDVNIDFNHTDILAHPYNKPLYQEILLRKLKEKKATAPATAAAPAAAENKRLNDNEIEAATAIKASNWAKLHDILQRQPLLKTNATFLPFIELLENSVALGDVSAHLQACLDAGAIIDDASMRVLITKLLTESSPKLQPLLKILLKLPDRQFNARTFFSLLLSNKNLPVANYPYLLQCIRLVQEVHITVAKLPEWVSLYSDCCKDRPLPESKGILGQLFAGFSEADRGAALRFAYRNNLDANYIQCLDELTPNASAIYSDMCSELTEAGSKDFVTYIYRNATAEERYQALLDAIKNKLHFHYIFGLAAIQQRPITNIKIFEYLILNGGIAPLMACLALGPLAHLLQPDEPDYQPAENLWDLARNRGSRPVDTVEKLAWFEYPLSEFATEAPQKKFVACKTELLDKLKFLERKIDWLGPNYPALPKKLQPPTEPTPLSSYSAPSTAEVKSTETTTAATIKTNPWRDYLLFAHKHRTPPNTDTNNDQKYCGFIFDLVLDESKETIPDDIIRDYIPSTMKLLYAVEVAREQTIISTEHHKVFDKLLAAAQIKGTELARKHGALTVCERDAKRLGLEFYRDQFVTYLNTYGLAALLNPSKITAAVAPAKALTPGRAAVAAFPDKSAAAAAPVTPFDFSRAAARAAALMPSCG